MSLIRNALAASAAREIALEAIAFQDPAFGLGLVAAFQELIDANLKPAEAQKHEAIKTIMALTKKKTGIKVSFNVDTEEPPCTMPAVVNLNSPIIQEWIRPYIKGDHNLIMKHLEKSKKEAWVDLKNGTVGGFFSELDCPILMSWKFCMDMKFTARELTGVYLHEVGHNFVNYELLQRSVTANQIMVAAGRALNTAGPDAYKVVLKQAGEIVENDPEFFSEITDVTDGQVIVTAILTGVLQSSRSESGTRNYDNNTWEALADNYAVRQGFGRDMVTALEKLGKAYGFPEFGSAARISAAFSDIITMLVGVAAATGSLAMILGGITFNPFFFVVGIMLSSLMVLLFPVHGEGGRDRTYDDMIVRFRRIREQEIEYLKIRKLDAKTVKRVTQSIKDIDQILAGMKDYKGPLRLLSNFFISSNKRELDAVAIQRKLEELNANDIFAKAAELRGV